MSIELKQAAEQALDLSTPTLREMVTRHAAVIDSRATLEDMPEALAFQIDMARALLREFAALPQAEAPPPDTPKPVGFTYRTEIEYADFTGRNGSFWRVPPYLDDEAVPLYDHSAPSVPDDSKRLDYLQDRGATIDLIAGVADFYPMQFRVGGLHSSANIDVRAAIDAAMLAAK